MGKQTRISNTQVAILNQGLAGIYAGFLEAVNSSVRSRWGWLPILSLMLSTALAWVAIAFQLSMEEFRFAELAFWIGLLLMIIPVTIRLLSLEATRRERIGLIVLLGMSLYLVKVMHSPFAFTFADELVHAHNVNEILSEGRLFNENAILPVTPLYPGLEIVTAGLAALTGLSTFASGLTVIGVARLVISLTLFLFYEKISRSARLAGLASVIYMGNSNYLYWSAQFSYESLALPLLILTLFAVALRQEKTQRITYKEITAVLLILILAIVVTHHITSYALLTILWTLVIVSWIIAFRHRGQTTNFLGLALVASIATFTWLFLVARPTIEYLFPVVSRAIMAGFNLLIGAGGSRLPFQPVSGLDIARPAWEQVIGIGSVLLILFMIPLGLLQIWRRYRRAVFPIVLAIAALVYFPIQGLRLTGAGWEMANRASEFLFVGIAFVFALAVLTHWAQRPSPGKTLVVTAIITIIFMGGFISGWPPQLRLARPYEISIHTQQGSNLLVEPQGVTAARWARQKLGTDNRMATDNSNARLMMLYGDQYPLAGGANGINDLILSEQIGRGEREIVSENDLHYLVFARPLINWDKMLGLYYDPTFELPANQTEWVDVKAYQKFDGQESVNRILDTGLILIYDIGVLNNAQK